MFCLKIHLPVAELICPQTSGQLEVISDHILIHSFPKLSPSYFYNVLNTWNFPHYRKKNVNSIFFQIILLVVLSSELN